EAGGRDPAHARRGRQDHRRDQGTSSPDPEQGAVKDQERDGRRRAADQAPSGKPRGAAGNRATAGRAGTAAVAAVIDCNNPTTFARAVRSHGPPSTYFGCFIPKRFILPQFNRRPTLLVFKAL